jgi:probable biosynthetic protein (TIGR04099 family)
MNVMARPRYVGDLPGIAAATVLPQPEGSVLLGMPQLSGVGLSENWLLKELGHRHWMALAKAAGMDAPDFRDDAGQHVYAAFCAIRIEEARFDLARENGRLAIATSLARVSRTQVLSRHALVIDGTPAGTVEMISAFVKRTGSSNHSIARVSIGGLMPIDPSGSNLPGIAASFRSRRNSRHFGFDLTQVVGKGPAYLFDPCPAQDFNGAGFLYFSSFLGAVDRAEWQHERTFAVSLRGREAYYYGNVDTGEKLRVFLVGSDASTRWWQIRRDETGAILADIFTRRR